MDVRQLWTVVVGGAGLQAIVARENLTTHRGVWQLFLMHGLTWQKSDGQNFECVRRCCCGGLPGKEMVAWFCLFLSFLALELSVYF